MGKTHTLEMCGLCGKLYKLDRQVLCEIGDHWISAKLGDADSYGHLLQPGRYDKADTDYLKCDRHHEVCDECYKEFVDVVQGCQAWFDSRRDCNAQEVVLHDKHGRNEHNVSGMWTDESQPERRGTKVLRKLLGVSRAKRLPRAVEA